MFFLHDVSREFLIDIRLIFHFLNKKNYMLNQIFKEMGLPNKTNKTL